MRNAIDEEQVNTISVEEMQTWSLETIDGLQEKLTRARPTVETRHRNKAIEAARAAAEALGFKLSDLITPAAGRATGRKGKREVKYRNPTNHAQTWTGRGRRPVWVKQMVESGSNLEDLKA